MQPNPRFIPTIDRLTALAAVGFAFFFLVACSSETEETNDDTPKGPPLTVTVQNTFNGTPFSIGDTLTVEDKYMVVVEDFRYLLSDAKAFDANGKAVPLSSPGMIFDLKNGSELNWAAGSAPAGDYTGLSFLVGLPNKVNHQNVTDLADDHPLHDPDMHWSWNPDAGYKFLVLEGQVAALEDGTPGAFEKLAYHIATDATAQPVERLAGGMQFNVTETGGQAYIRLDVAPLLTGRNLLQENHTESMGKEQIALAVKLSEKFKGMFSRGSAGSPTASAETPR